MDDTFAAYQALRAKAEQEAKAAMLSWGMNAAPDGMTVAQLRDVTDTVVKLLNHHTRQVYDMARSTPA